MRIGGLASGMDIDTLVKDLMKAERIPLDKLSQKKTTLEWQRDDYRSMNKLLSDLDNLIFETIGRPSNFSKKSVTSSNPSAVSASANGTAINTTINMEVMETAKPATWVDTSKSVSSTYISSQDRTLSFEIMNGSGVSEGIKTINIKAGDNLTSISAAFNNSGLGVSAFYDSQKQQFVLTKKDSGSQSSIKVQDSITAEFMGELGFQNSIGELSGKTAGLDAKFTINGYETTRSTNTFSINGINYNLLQKGTSSLTVGDDTNATVESIRTFVNKYNETIDAINKKIGEAKYRDYTPLTSEQRKDLSEKEAEMWDEKAKSGLLRNDSSLSNGLNSMRQILYNNINTGDSKYDLLSEIGIGTSKNYLNKGKLEIDENKLRNALSEKPEAVMKLFNGNGTEVGIVQKLRESIKSTIVKIESKAGNEFRNNSSLARELEAVNKRIFTFEDRLVQVENRYWRQFQAMEAAVQRSNQQGAYLMQQFGGGQ